VAPETLAQRAQPAPTSPRNLTGVRLNLFTVVTPDLEASIRFYTGLMGYALAARGVTPDATGALAGSATGGRPYALLKYFDSDHGLLRLLQAPAGAAPNRPLVGPRAWDLGFGAIECSTSDIEESYQTLTRAGVKTITPPTYYFYRDMRRLNGSTMYPKSLDTLTYVAFGPAGERIYISIVLPDNFGRSFQSLHTECHNCFVVNTDRQPLWDFYGQAFGLSAIAEYQGTLSAQRAVNRLLGESADSEMWAGGMGDDFGMEYMEWKPPAGIIAQRFPQSLDRTGHAMLTVSVNSLDEVRQRLQAAGIAIESEGALPTLQSPRPEGFILRGASGELIEVVDRDAI